VETVDARLTPAHRRYLETLARAASPARVHTRSRNPVLDDLCAWRYAEPVTFQKHSEDDAITARRFEGRGRPARGSAPTC
jgi:hypothetical protein